MFKKYHVTVIDSSTGEKLETVVTIGYLGKKSKPSDVYNVIKNLIDPQYTFEENDIIEIKSIVSIQIAPYCPN